MVERSGKLGRRQAPTAIVCAALIFCSACVSTHGTEPSEEGCYFGGSRQFDRYSPPDQIDRHNVSQLETVWVRPSLDASITQQFPDLEASPYLRSTPIMIDAEERVVRRWTMKLLGSQARSASDKFCA